MIAHRLSAVLVPRLEKLLVGTKVIGGGLVKALGLAIVKAATWLVTDFVVIAGGAAIVWGIHFFGSPVPIGIPAAWIIGGVLTVLFVAVNIKPLR